MKKYVLRILLFFVIIAVIDIIAGKVFWYLQSTKSGGGTGAEYYVCKEGTEEILIMGSSRASHHYVSQLFQDSLGMSCFNGGQEGNGIVLQYGRWKMLSKRHIPKLVIFDIEPAFDLNEGDNTRYIDRLKPFAGDKDVKQYVSSLFPMEYLKLFSHLYRYNYKFLEILSDCVQPGVVDGGYRPKHGHIRAEMITSTAVEPGLSLNNYDDVKITQLRNLISDVLASGSKIVLISSPYWKSHGAPDMQIIQQIADEYGVLFFNFADSDLCNNPDYFADSMHLNDEGAVVFSKEVIRRLKRLGII